jgi:hypothetical protein
VKIKQIVLALRGLCEDGTKDESGEGYEFYNRSSSYESVPFVEFSGWVLPPGQVVFGVDYCRQPHNVHQMVPDLMLSLTLWKFSLGVNVYSKGLIGH